MVGGRFILLQTNETLKTMRKETVRAYIEERDESLYEKSYKIRAFLS